MSATIDQRIVEMKFDNKQFGSGIQTTLGDIVKLKAGLKLLENNKATSNLQSGFQNVNTASLNNAIGLINSRLSTMGVIGTTALQNIVNSAVNAGKRIVHALTLEPVTTGFQEYETQMGAIQTIMANTGLKGQKGIDKVNAALGDLNTYADQTIYNFTEMTRNIGTFTAAGIKLGPATSAIKGIANLAAISGSTSQQASTAMYQLSQALAAGTVNLQDWNSVVNAGMGGKVFQNALKRTAKQMGKTIDETKTFRESISAKGGDAWLDGEVLSQTLQQLSGDLSDAELKAQGYSKAERKEILELADTAQKAATEVKTVTQLWDTTKEAMQSGWTATWQYIIGDFGEAKTLLTGISNTLNDLINGFNDARNNVLFEWKKLGGRDDLVAALGTLATSAGQIFAAIGRAFSSVFEGITGKQLAAATKSFRKFTKSIEVTKDSTKGLERIFKGLFQVIKIPFTLIVGAIKVLLPFVKVLARIPGILIKILSPLGAIAIKIGEIANSALGRLAERSYDLAVKMADVLSKVEKYLGTFIDALSQGKSLFVSLGAVYGQMVDAGENPAAIKFIIRLMDLVRPLSFELEKATSQIKSYFKGITPDNAIKSIDGAFSVVRSKIGPIKDALGEFFEALSNGEITLSNAKDNFKEFGDTVGKAGNKLDISGKVEKTKNALSNLINMVKEFIGKQDLNSTIAIFERVGSLFFLKSLGKWIGSFANFNNKLAYSTKQFGKIFKSASKVVKSYSRDIQATSLLKIAVAIGILVTSLVALSQIPEKDLWRALKVMGALAVGLVALFAAITFVYSKIKGLSEKDPWDNLAKSLSNLVNSLSKLVTAAAFTVAAAGLNLLAAGIIKMVGAIVLISKLNVDKLTSNIQAFVVVLGTIIGLGALATALGASAAQLGFGMLAMSLSLKIMLSVFKSIAEMDMDPAKLVKTVIGFGAVMTAFTVLTRVAGSLGSQASLASGLSVLALAGSLYILVDVVKRLASLSAGELAKGLISIGGLTACMSALMVTSQYTKKVNVKTIGAISVIIGLLAAAIFILAKLPLKQSLAAAAELTVVIGAVSLLCVALSKMKSFKSAIIGVATITLVLGALVGFFFLMKKLNLGEMVSLGVQLAAVLATLSGVALALTAVGEFGAAAIKGAGVFVAMIGVLGVGLGVIGELSDKLNGAEHVAKAIPLLTTIGQAIGSFIGGIVGGIALGAVSTLPLIGASLSLFMMSIQPFLNGLSEDHSAALSGAKALAETILILTGAELISQLTSFITGGSTSLTSFGKQLSQFGPMYKEFISSMSDVSEEDANKVSILSKSLKALAEVAKIVSGSGSGGLKGLALGHSDLKSFGKTLKPFAKGISGFAKEAEGITDEHVEAIKRATKVASAIISMANSIQRSGGVIGQIFGDKSLSSFGEGMEPFALNLLHFANTIHNINDDALEKVPIATKVASGIVNMANSIQRSGGMVSQVFGNNTLAGFGEGLEPFGLALIHYANTIHNLPDVALEKLPIATAAAKGLVNLLNALPKEGGLFQAYMGKQSFAGISSYLASFGEALKAYGENVGGLNESQINNIGVTAKAAKALAKLLKAMPRDEGVFQFLSGSKSFRGLSEYLTDLGAGLKSYSDSVAGGINVEAINTSVSAIKKLVGVLKVVGNVDAKAASGFKRALSNLAKTGVSGFTTGINRASNTKVVKAVTSMVKKAASVANSKKETLKKAGVKMAKSLASGLKDESAKKTAYSAGKTLATRAKSGAGSVSMFKTGQSAADGFINGIKSRLGKAYRAGASLHSSAQRGAKKKGDTHSPSRAMRKVGNFFGQGFTLGIDDQGGSAFASGQQLAGSSLDGVQSVLSKLTTFLDDNIQLDPTIRPTLDLSGVQNGSMLLSQMLNDPILSSADAASRLGNISSNSPFANFPTANQFAKMLNDAITPQDPINPNDIYNAVRAGAQDANVSVSIGNREFNRHLRENGVRFRR